MYHYGPQGRRRRDAPEGSWNHSSDLVMSRVQVRGQTECVWFLHSVHGVSRKGSFPASSVVCVTGRVSCTYTGPSLLYFPQFQSHSVSVLLLAGRWKTKLLQKTVVLKLWNLWFRKVTGVVRGHWTRVERETTIVDSERKTGEGKGTLYST